jgi:dihydrofolate synthase/folylpolyglutamate synthase
VLELSPPRIATYFAELQRFGIRPGLDRIRALLIESGRPDATYPIVLVGGTNGKGSTSEFTARHLAAQSRNIGLYTSPHIYRWNERLRIVSGETQGAQPDSTHPFPDAISDDTFTALLDAALPSIEAVAKEYYQPTEFEVITLMGLLHFARQQVDAAVIEVGLGGQWDATNVTDPLVSVVTHVALDHTDRLGNTVEAIAADKVQIARPGRVLVTSDIQESVLEVFREYCDRIGARLWPLRRPDFSNDTTALTTFLQQTPPLPMGDSPDWQAINARTAQAAAWAMEEALSWEHAPVLHPYRGVPGRAEVIRQKPTLLVDGANNPDGAARLAEHLKSTYPNRRLIFVAGISADKDWASMLTIWAPLAHTFIATQATHPRAAPAATLAAEATRLGAPSETFPAVMDAVRRALTIAEPDDVICVTGSFFVLAEVDREEVVINF